ncbi:MAG: S1 RNA-binding domain-containing protein [Patescibacteria group bacterium]|nr:S1 RNA-binding domain-containing protein [Patescibacteria group bacterium]MBU1877148.1 S1 RNA-binding domain-containing protein [Patescibacteria group bacterium]
MKKLLEKEDQFKALKIDQIVEGKVIGRGRSAVFLDISPFGTGIIYGREFYNAKEELKEMDIGANISAKIIEVDNKDGYIELSISSASQELSWDKLKELKDNEELVEVKILGANKGGLLARVHGVNAFLPVSQLNPEHYPRVEKADPNKILNALQEFVGKNLTVKVLDISVRNTKLILSERAKDSEKIKEVLKKYEVDQIVMATVTGITDFGVFVNFGEEKLEGLIHISELDWAIVEDPSKIVKMDEEIEAKIININNNKVFLSLKALKHDPWQDIDKRYKEGTVISGEVLKLNPFGAFIKVEDKIQGLIHVSELGTQEQMKEKLKVGEKYKFKILSVEPKEHKITLALTE